MTISVKKSGKLLWWTQCVENDPTDHLHRPRQGHMTTSSRLAVVAAQTHRALETAST
ncbi:hypothetical protein J6590_068258 [Homalodisca vitripennis]|nr:hypothetical protein J6590_068258 [Homalodisca vitripennis]